MTNAIAARPPAVRVVINYLILAHNRNVVTVLDGDTGNISQCAAFWRGGEQMANIQTADGQILLNAASVISSEC